MAAAAGAPYVTRTSTYAADLVDEMAAAIGFDGFSIMDMWGVCPGRYTKRNKLTPKMIETGLTRLPPFQGPVEENQRPEYGRSYPDMARGGDRPGSVKRSQGLRLAEGRAKGKLGMARRRLWAVWRSPFFYHCAYGHMELRKRR